MQSRIVRKLFLLTILWSLLILTVSTTSSNIFRFGQKEKALAATSSTINYQARLLTNTGALVPDGFYNVEFKLYSASAGGTAQWTETYYDSNGSTAGNDNRVRVVNGYLSVYLGSLTSFPSTINWDQEQWITLNIGGTSQTATPTWDGEMSPRLKLSATPYALTAGSLQKTSGSNELKLNLATPTADVTYTLQDAAVGSYDICTTATVCTGYAAASGSNNYIQNGTSPQTASFNITGSGTVGGLLTGSAGATISGATINLNASSNFNTNINTGTSTGTVSIGNSSAGAISLQSSSTISLTSGTTINLTSTGANNINLTPGGSSNTGVLVKPTNNSTAAFQVQTALGTGVFTVDTSNQRVGIGAAPLSGYELYVQSSSDATLRARNIGSANILELANNSSTVALVNNSGQLQLSTTGSAGGMLLGGDANLYRGAAEILQTDSEFHINDNSLTIERANDFNGAIHLNVVGDTDNRFTLQAGGALEWGDGTNSPDTNLYRDSDDVLKTNSSFIIQDGETTAFQVQNAGGTAIFNVDSLNATIQVDNGGGVTGESYASFNNRAVFGYDGTTQDALIRGSSGKGIRFYTDDTVNALTFNAQGHAIFQNGTNSTAAFQIQNASSSVVLNANTEDGGVTIGSGADFNDSLGTFRLYGTGTNGAGARIMFGDGNLSSNQNVWIGEYGSGDSDQLLLKGDDGIHFDVSGTSEFLALSLNGNGHATFKSATNSASAFQVQNASGNNILSVDTSQTTYATVHVGGSGTSFSELLLNQGASALWGIGTDDSSLGGTDGFYIYKTGTSSQFGLSSIGAATFRNITNSTTAFQIENAAGTAFFTADTTNQRIGIGTSPSFKLDVSDSQASTYVARITNSNTANTADGLLINLGVANASRGTGNYFVGFAGAGTVAGKIQGGANAVAYTTTAADYAEYFLAEDANDKPQVGEIVSLSSNTNNAVDRAIEGNAAIVGVISENPGFVGNGPICDIDDEYCDTNYKISNVMVGMTGQLPVKVTTENGVINRGDPIAVGSVEGIGAKAVGFGPIVGYAMESYSGVGVGLIKLYLNPSYYNSSTSTGSIQNGGESVLYGVVVNGNAEVTGNVQIGGNVEITGDSTSHNLTVVGTTILQGNLVAGQDLTVSGNSQLQQVTANALDITGNASVNSLTANVATLEQITAGDARITNLTVSGTANIGTLNVSGNSFFDGTVTLSGALITTGDLPTIEYLDAAWKDADELTIETNQAEVAVEGNDITGMITLTTGDNPVIGELLKLKFHNQYAQPPRVIFSPSNDKAAQLQVFRSNTTGEYFVLQSINTPQANTTYKYDYFIIQTQ